MYNVHIVIEMCNFYTFYIAIKNFIKFQKEKQNEKKAFITNFNPLTNS